MKVLSTMKFVVRKCDLFRTNSLLRYRDDPEYQSVTGGICSLTMLLVFAIVFTQTIIGTVNKTFINASRSLEEES